MKDLGLRRRIAEANVYVNATSDVFIVVYVDDIMIVGDPTKVDHRPRVSLDD